MGGLGMGKPALAPNPGTLGLLLYLSPLLRNTGWAVTVPFHERQYCLMNESLGLNKAKVHGLGKPQTQGETHVCMAETGLGNVLASCFESE